MTGSQVITVPIDHHLPWLPPAADGCRWFSAALPVKVLEEDLWRYKTHFYSHELFSPGGKAVVLVVGARSGLFALHFASLGKSVSVVAVEPNPALFGALTDTLGLCRQNNISCFPTYSEACTYINTLDVDGFIDLALIDRHAFDYQTLATLARQFHFGHLCGEFDPAASRAIDLYRFSGSFARTFFWQKGVHRLPMSGTASTGIEVSIVVPMYNVEKYLEKCLQSLVDQTLERKEIILVDDGSPDASGRIADEWANRYPEIRVIHQENGGCAAARSRGLMEAQGDYVAFVDSDDWVDAPMFEHLYEAAVTNNADVSQCGFREVYVDDGVIIPRFEEFRDVSEGAEDCVVVDARDLMTVQPTIWRRIYKTEFLRHNGIDFHSDLPRYDDLPFQFEVFMHTSRMVCIPEIYYNYRLGRVGQDVTADDERLYVHFDIFRILRGRVAELADAAVERELVRVEVNTHVWGLQKIKRELKWRYVRSSSRDIYGQRQLLGRWAVFRVAWKASRKYAVLALLADLFLPGNAGKFADTRKV